MGQDATDSRSIVGYVTSYICFRKTEHWTARRVWLKALDRWETAVRQHWGW